MFFFGFQIRNIKSVSNKRSGWFRIDRCNIRKLISRSNGVSNSIGSEIAAPWLSILDIIGSQVIGSNKFIFHDMAGGHRFYDCGIIKILSWDMMWNLLFTMCSRNIMHLKWGLSVFVISMRGRFLINSFLHIVFKNMVSSFCGKCQLNSIVCLK